MGYTMGYIKEFFYAGGYSTAYTMVNNHNCLYHEVSFVMAGRLVIECPMVFSTKHVVKEWSKIRASELSSIRDGEKVIDTIRKRCTKHYISIGSTAMRRYMHFLRPEGLTDQMRVTG